MDFKSQFSEIALVERVFRLVPRKDAFKPDEFRSNLFETTEEALFTSAEHGVVVDIVGEALRIDDSPQGAVTIWATVNVSKKSPLFQLTRSNVEAIAQVKRLWMLIGKSSNSYAAGFEGTFMEALRETLIDAAYWKTPYECFEADPKHYRRMGGLKELWAAVTVPGGSPVRNGVLIHG